MDRRVLRRGLRRELHEIGGKPQVPLGGCGSGALGQPVRSPGEIGQRFGEG
jgi:hypothetical protein